MKRHILLIISALFIIAQSIQAQQAVQPVRYPDQKDFKFKTNIDDTKIFIHNIKIECLSSDEVKVTIEASLFDAHANKKSTNQLKGLSEKNIALFLDSQYIGHPNELKCSGNPVRTEGVDLGLVVDRSGSMSERISEFDQGIRINAMKNTLGNFFGVLKPTDSAFIESFSNDVRLDQDWTSDVGRLRDVVNSMTPWASTQFYGALLESIYKINSDSKRPRAIIALSDGVNNVYPEWSTDLLHRIKHACNKTKVYVVALGLSNSPWDLDGRQKMEIITQLTGGKYFDVYTSSGLDSIYRELNSEIDYENYCKIIFKTKSKFTKRTLDLFVNINANNAVTYTAQIPFYDICKHWKDTTEQGEKRIRIRFCTATDEQDYRLLKLELLSLGFEVNERRHERDLDLISLELFPDEADALRAIQAFKNWVEAHPEKLDKSKINTAVVYEEKEMPLPMPIPQKK